MTANAFDTASANDAALFLIGHPIGHSLSPTLQRAAFVKCGLNWTYDLHDCVDEAAARSFIESEAWTAMNITTPYKPVAFELATHKAASAKLAGGVNLLVRRGGARIGFNLDGQGMVLAAKHLGAQVAGADVVVCGTGPTARAIMHALATAGVACVSMLSRDADRAFSTVSSYVQQLKELSEAAIDLGGGADGERSLGGILRDCAFRAGAYENSERVLSDASIIIDATTLGMHEGDPAPFDTEVLHEGQTVIDVVYGHGETALVSAARSAGCTASDGLGMLVGQAALGFEAVCAVCGVDIEPSTEDLFATMLAAVQ